MAVISPRIKEGVHKKTKTKHPGGKLGEAHPIFLKAILPQPHSLFEVPTLNFPLLTFALLVGRPDFGHYVRHRFLGNSDRVAETQTVLTLSVRNSAFQLRLKCAKNEPKYFWGMSQHIHRVGVR